ncbi:FAD-dependent oxidoreductase [Kurthia sibirica]|uniref:3-oxosteroid 1-dehydrogenase n=1 Tax=Kurthia sibirica TaxID=202750 RepID=A0A2U3AJG0_9BACL|nr:FAD-dependent oxidoreductase [Kurthia sibirica]PWI24706.1 3-oxosteroid 1-dehydrogenase [Kurthia sibirica]GEK34550.1 3-oxosteroid 1-dehydrogenase [Kurthia sibirica]
MEWDFEYDVIVVGSGASGFAAAITAQKEGLHTLLIEKEKTFGGASALSGGGVWVPNNRYLQEAGVADSFDEAKKYLDSTIGNRVSDDIKETYLKRGIEMLDFMHTTSPYMRFSYAKNYADYYPNLPGGKGHGRSIEPDIFDLNKLGDWKILMRPPAMDTKGFVMNGQDFVRVNMITRTWAGKIRSLTLGWRLMQHLVLRKELAALGQALIGRLALAYKELDGELWVNSGFKDFIFEGDRVIGITIDKHGKVFNIKANRGVILGSGGFSQNAAYREKFLPSPTNVAWSSAPPGQTGDIITPAEKLGAKFDLMDKVWGAPSIIDHTGRPFFLVADRGIPRMIIVDQDGKRYINEPTPYHEFIDIMYKHQAATDKKAIHSWIILDKRSKKRYLFAGQFPGQDFPQPYYDNEVVLAGDSIAELEKKMAIQDGNLTATIKRFNGFVDTGKDADFGRGESAHDRYYGDPTLANPNLDKIDEGPFYALKVYPGDIGTKGGVVIDKFSRILKEDDTPIKGVYACGNCSASIMGEAYPGPGATLGPGMTFGYIAAKHCLENK